MLRDAAAKRFVCNILAELIVKVRYSTMYGTVDIEHVLAYSKTIVKCHQIIAVPFGNNGRTWIGRF
jgi:hypothetical protein